MDIRRLYQMGSPRVHLHPVVLASSRASQRSIRPVSLTSSLIKLKGITNLGFNTPLRLPTRFHPLLKFSLHPPHRLLMIPRPRVPRIIRRRSLQSRRRRFERGSVGKCVGTVDRILDVGRDVCDDDRFGELARFNIEYRLYHLLSDEIGRVR